MFVRNTTATSHGTRVSYWKQYIKVTSQVSTETGTMIVGDMLHLVVKPYDPSLNYEDYCKQLFGENKCLAMLEKKGGDHLHIQGVLNVDEFDFKKIQTSMITTHYRKKVDPTCHPVKKRKRGADDVGFQYMAKELPTSVVIYKQGFSDQDLQELYEKSEQLRSELQCKLGEYIAANCVRQPGERPRDLHLRMCRVGFDYYLGEDKMQPPNFKLLIRHFLLKIYREHEDVMRYLCEITI